MLIHSYINTNRYKYIFYNRRKNKKEIVAVTIDPEVVDPDDVEMLEDLIMAAANEALRKMDEVSQSSMAKITGGLGGGFGF